MQEHVRERLGREQLPVQLHPVRRLDEGGEPRHLAVHTHPARPDQLLGPTSRGDAGAGQVGVQAHSPALFRRAGLHHPDEVHLAGDERHPAWRDRVEEAEQAIEERGGKLLDAYVTLGRYDVVELFEAPDDETAYRILTELAKHGQVTTETLRAFTREEADRIVKGIA